MGKRLPSYSGCFGCGIDNPIGVALKLEWDNGKVTAPFIPKGEYSGFEGVIHGGIVCTLLDEVMWWAIAAQDKKCTVTAEMKIKFHRPVTSRDTYRVEGWVKEHPKGRIYIAAGRVVNGEEEICADAEARFITLPDSEWERFLEGLTDPSFFSQDERETG